MEPVCRFWQLADVGGKLGKGGPEARANCWQRETRCHLSSCHLETLPNFLSANCNKETARALSLSGKTNWNTCHRTGNLILELGVR